MKTKMRKFKIFLLSLIFFAPLNFVLADSNYYFDTSTGVNQYYSVQDYSQINSADFTIQFWFKRNYNTTGGAWIYTTENVGGSGWINRGHGIQFYNTDSTDGEEQFPFIVASGSEVEYHYFDPVTITQGLWYNISLTYASATGYARLYINGVFHDDNDIVTNGFNDVPDLHIGNYFTLNDPIAVDVLIDDFKLYNYLMTDEEVASNQDCTISTTGLVAYYEFEQNGLDSSVNANDLTEFNTPDYGNTDMAFTCEVAPEPTATTTVDLYPCELPENTVLQRVTGCVNIYDDTSSTTPVSVLYYYFDFPFLLWIFIFLMIILGLLIIYFYIYVRKK